MAPLIGPKMGTDGSGIGVGEPSRNVDNTAGGRNHLRFVMIGDEGWVYINGKFEGNVDLNGLTDISPIKLVLGVEKEGETTRFEDFTIWKWHPDLASLPLTPSPTSIPTAKPVKAAASIVSWWPGEGNANDIVDGNDGKLMGGATFAPGKVGQGFSFDGIDDFVLVSDRPNLRIRGDLTVELWAKRTGFGGRAFMLMKGGGAIETRDVPSSYFLSFGAGGRTRESGDYLRCCFEDRDGYGIGFIGPQVTDTDFHHYAYVRFGNRHKLFMDGIIINEGDFDNPPGSTNGLPLVIGGIRSDTDPSGYRLHFTGVIDELSIYDQALSDGQIKTIYNAGSAGKAKP